MRALVSKLTHKLNLSSHKRQINAAVVSDNTDNHCVSSALILSDSVTLAVSDGLGSPA